RLLVPAQLPLRALGLPEGCGVGSAVGLPEPCGVGSPVGLLDPRGVGRTVGLPDPCGVGRTAGLPECCDGVGAGREDGGCVGAAAAQYAVTFPGPPAAAASSLKATVRCLWVPCALACAHAVHRP